MLLSRDVGSEKNIDGSIFKKISISTSIYRGKNIDTSIYRGKNIAKKKVPKFYVTGSGNLADHEFDV